MLALLRACAPHIVVALCLGSLGVVLGLAVAETATWGPL